MILSKADLKEYLKRDMRFLREQRKYELFIYKITSDPIYYIDKYIKYLRKEEYYYNVRQDKVGVLCYLYYFRKKNKLGNKLGIKIPKNCFGPGLIVYHHGEIIVNESAKVGSDCKLHGGNCIGNNGKSDATPIIGNGLDLGIGAKIIGDVSLGNNVSVGANAVVVKSFKKDNITLVGIPAIAK